LYTSETAVQLGIRRGKIKPNIAEETYLKTGSTSVSRQKQQKSQIPIPSAVNQSEFTFCYIWYFMLKEWRKIY